MVTYIYTYVYSTYRLNAISYLWILLILIIISLFIAGSDKEGVMRVSGSVSEVQQLKQSLLNATPGKVHTYHTC